MPIGLSRPTHYTRDFCTGHSVSELRILEPKGARHGEKSAVADPANKLKEVRKELVLAPYGGGHAHIETAEHL